MQTTDLHLLCVDCNLLLAYASRKLITRKEAVARTACHSRLSSEGQQSLTHIGALLDLGHDNIVVGRIDKA